MRKNISNVSTKQVVINYHSKQMNDRLSDTDLRKHTQGRATLKSNVSNEICSGNS